MQNHAPKFSRRMLLRGVPAAVGLTALAGCTNASERLAEETNTIPNVDLSGIKKQPDIAALVPKPIRDRGLLQNGAATDYAPGEFLNNGKPVGYDIDVLAAIGKVFGLKTATESAVFAQIIPSVGPKYDVGISSFTIDAERLKSVNMVSYFQAGVAYAVKAGNPYGIDPHELSGKRPAVQVGTFMEEVAYEEKAKCDAAGKPTVDVLSYANNSDAVTNVAGGKADLLMADSPVVNYAISRSRGTLERVGKVEDTALNGIAISKEDDQLTEAVHKAVQFLIDSGDLNRIMKAWGNEDGALDTSEVNPA